MTRPSCQEAGVLPCPRSHGLPSPLWAGVHTCLAFLLLWESSLADSHLILRINAFLLVSLTPTGVGIGVECQGLTPLLSVPVLQASAFGHAWLWGYRVVSASSPLCRRLGSLSEEPMSSHLTSLELRTPPLSGTRLGVGEQQLTRDAEPRMMESGHCLALKASISSLCSTGWARLVNRAEFRPWPLQQAYGVTP